MNDRFDIYGALWALCSRWHGGQGSRGYRLLSRLAARGYRPGLGLQQGQFESDTQRMVYRRWLRLRHTL